MSEQITQDMKAMGVAQVLVFMKSDAPSTKAGVSANIGDHFTKSEFSVSAAVAEATDEIKSSSVPKMQYYPNLGVAIGTVDREGLAALRAEPNVDKISGAPQLGLIRPRETTAASLTSNLTWGIKALGIKELWDQGLSGKGIVVGHLDTGVDRTHPALQGALFGFTEFNGLGIKDAAANVNTAHDSGEHGTHTAATILGRPVNGKSVGVAPEARLASAMVIEGGNVVTRVMGGMDWAVGQGVKVLSMSLGFPGYLKDFMGLITIIRAKGILPVFAIGNEFAGHSRSPGNYWNALSVGACNEQMAVSEFSSSQLFNRKRDPIVPDLVAPGEAVISAKPGGGYQSMDGTSMATPHIAGLAALLWEYKPDATVKQIEKAIYGSCELPPTMSRPRANRGMPNGPRALALL